MMASTPDDAVLKTATTSKDGAGINVENVAGHQQDAPTASHALAQDEEAPSEETRRAGEQVSRRDEVEVKNLGWHHQHTPDADAGSRGSPSPPPPPPLVRGLPNEELWTLIRRFDKQIFHVKSIDDAPPTDLDLNVGDDEDFSPDKLRAQLERLYMVVLFALFAVWKHVVRLRSWREGRRTGVFMGVYAGAWALDVLVPVLAGFALVLVVYAPARAYYFPPAPPALIDPSTGGVQKPAAGVLASDDSMTGAPEKHQGEAVEQEAHSFVNSMSTIVVSTAAGKHPQGDPDEDMAAPDPTEMTELMAHARDRADGQMPTAKHDRTKEPVSRAMWARARPAMHAIADFVDTWERFGNALSPTVPFHRHRPKLRLAACLVPIIIGSYFTTSYMFLKSISFITGFVFFGDPVITPAIGYLDTLVPDWKQYLELRSTLLRGVPTNAQLVITLLRVGERNKAPLPPPPISGSPPPVRPHATAGRNLEHLEGATDEEIEAAVAPEPGLDADDDRGEQDDLLPGGNDGHHGKRNKAKRFLDIIRGTARGGVQTALTADKAKAKAGAEHARNRLGVVRRPGKPSSDPDAGPVVFPSRYKGQKGFAYLTTTATSPALSWAPGSSSLSDAAVLEKVQWSVAVAEIAELKKVGGLGWKSKIVVGWALGGEVVDGLVVTTKGGEELHLTAIMERDGLFNRLIAIGSQMWESR